MLDADLMFRPVGELADLVRRGEVAARELVELSISRIEELDPQLDAFIDVDGDRALAEADAISPGDERPFAGVPIAIKNNRAVAGWRYTIACDLMGDFRPDFDHAVVRRLKEAGFVVVGTTNLPEYGIQPVSEPRRFPASRNPWDRDRTPGGSSGGSAAAVAAGMVPIAHANDGGGSTRIPAACCGLVGLKPQRGRLPLGPELGDHTLAQDGVLTRTVAETAQLLDLLNGHDIGDATWAPPPSEPYVRAVERDPGPLRIGVAVNPPLPDATVDPLCLAAVDQTAALLEQLGHDVEQIEPSWTNPALLPLFSVEFMTAIATQIGFSGLIAGREPVREDMQALSWAIFEQVRGLSALDFAGAHVQLQAMMRALIVELDPYDVVLTPGLAQRPLPIGTLKSDDDENPLQAFADAGLFTPFTAGLNASGQPALMLPLVHGDDGLPTGVQLIGRPAREDVLLAVGAQLERARPWADRRAPIS
ncbi:MAG TPA: amidase [Capillimicrobium sp.]|nr:amidase [Capillimicrobium sp.]